MMFTLHGKKYENGVKDVRNTGRPNNGVVINLYIGTCVAVQSSLKGRLKQITICEVL